MSQITACVIVGRNTHFSPCEAGLPGPGLAALAARQVHHPAVFDDPDRRRANDEWRNSNDESNPKSDPPSPKAITGRDAETEARRSTQRLSTGGSDFVIRNSFVIRASLFGFSVFPPQSV